jgi:hypothetical protein
LTAILVVLLSALLPGCADFGLERAQTFDQKLAYAYGTHTAVLTAAATALDAKRITADDARQVLEMADQTRALLDGARLLSATGDMAGAENRLALATAVLIQIQDYLNRQGTPK